MTPTDLAITIIIILLWMWAICHLYKQIQKQKLRQLQEKIKEIKRKGEAIEKELRQIRRQRYRPTYLEHKHRKIRGFKPKTAYEKRLWKPEAKPEEA